MARAFAGNDDMVPVCCGQVMVPPASCCARLPICGAPVEQQQGMCDNCSCNLCGPRDEEAPGLCAGGCMPCGQQEDTGPFTLAGMDTMCLMTMVKVVVTAVAFALVVTLGLQKGSLFDLYGMKGSDSQALQAAIMSKGHVRSATECHEYKPFWAGGKSCRFMTADRFLSSMANWNATVFVAYLVMLVGYFCACLLALRTKCASADHRDETDPFFLRRSGVRPVIDIAQFCVGVAAFLFLGPAVLDFFDTIAVYKQHTSGELFVFWCKYEQDFILMTAAAFVCLCQGQISFVLRCPLGCIAWFFAMAGASQETEVGNFHRGPATDENNDSLIARFGSTFIPGLFMRIGVNPMLWAFIVEGEIAAPPARAPRTVTGSMGSGDLGRSGSSGGRTPTGRGRQNAKDEDKEERTPPAQKMQDSSSSDDDKESPMKLTKKPSRVAADAQLGGGAAEVGDAHKKSKSKKSSKKSRHKSDGDTTDGGTRKKSKKSSKSKTKSDVDGEETKKTKKKKKKSHKSDGDDTDGGTKSKSKKKKSSS
eukprot:NODE_502_length_1864_cov_199.506045_g494_i0.p1 GENE.NODE_502_length_1864_cov_199.506045_g494_i0~~NODE_502_length_1864_cov_199.506045_g494_i0.p1  ORF type:complete len:534 (+),score=110.33 NODE_502_length_1864_cov_199.506045_g494_i0:65-1666(+)